MDSPFALLGFFSLFEVIGGAALGWSLRQFLARQLGATTLFFIVWGGMFAGIPLLMGAVFLAAVNAFALFAVQVFILTATIGISAFAPQEYLDTFGSWQMLFAGAGGIVMLVGGAFFGMNLRRDLLEAILVGGGLVTFGGIFFAFGIISALRNR